MAIKFGQKITYDDYDLHKSQRSTEVKCGYLLYGYHIWLDVTLI